MTSITAKRVRIAAPSRERRYNIAALPTVMKENVLGAPSTITVCSADLDVRGQRPYELVERLPQEFGQSTK